MVDKLTLPQMRDLVKGELNLIAILPASLGGAFREKYWAARMRDLASDLPATFEGFIEYWPDYLDWSGPDVEVYVSRRDFAGTGGEGVR